MKTVRLRRLTRVYGGDLLTQSVTPHEETLSEAIYSGFAETVADGWRKARAEPNPRGPSRSDQVGSVLGCQRAVVEHLAAHVALRELLKWLASLLIESKLTRLLQQELSIGCHDQPDLQSTMSRTSVGEQHGLDVIENRSLPFSRGGSRFVDKVVNECTRTLGGLRVAIALRACCWSTRHGDENTTGQESRFRAQVLCLTSVFRGARANSELPTRQLLPRAALLLVREAL